MVLGIMSPNSRKLLFGLILTLTLFFVISIYLQLELPTPTGPYAVGQTVLRWTDRSRPEILTDSPDDFRAVNAILWYPAEPDTGTRGAYFPGLSAVSQALVASGEVQAWQVFALRFVRAHTLWDGKPLTEDAAYPVLIFSPGNGTNVEFYDVLLSEIASHGYIVVGLNHPYDVAAIEASDQHVIEYFKEQDSMTMSQHERYIAERIQVRTQDVLFALKQLELVNSETGGSFEGMLDLEAVAVGGHSLGGITASEACKAEDRLRACFNMDGIQRGGPFSTEESAITPLQPFLFLTKESQLPPRLIEKFEAMNQSFFVVLHGASHQSFSDGPVLQPALLPFPNRADRAMSLIQGYVVAFLDQTLKGQRSDLLSKSLERQDVTVTIFPQR